MKNEALWNLVVRKPLRWFLRRFLSSVLAEGILVQIEELVRAAMEH